MVAGKVKIPSFGYYPKGFRAGAGFCGVKKNPELYDLAAIVSERPCNAAGVFTSNAFKAAPVQVDQKILKTGGGQGIRSVIVNSGCANAVTGTQGLTDAQAMVDAADVAIGAESVGTSSLVMSTGVIGQLLPIKKIVSGIPNLFERIGDSHDDWLEAAKGIMTTDTFPKLVSTEYSLNNQTYSMVGLTKGAGMIAPNMATLLGCIATDAPVASGALKKALLHAANASFNSISIDGDMSTNDTILALANGAAGGAEITEESAEFAEFEKVLTSTAQQLAKLVVRDGEGATKFVTINVGGAASDSDAKKIAETIANSMLFKCALYGKDANWGRILCAVGYSNVKVDPTKTNVSFVPTDGTEELKLLINGEPEKVDEARASEILDLADLEVKVNVGVGSGRSTFWTCDLSHEYVTINGDYRS